VFIRGTDGAICTLSLVDDNCNRSAETRNNNVEKGTFMWKLFYMYQWRIGIRDLRTEQIRNLGKRLEKTSVIMSGK
jgi:hypothetical protein